MSIHIQTRKKRVLIVDDSVFFRRQITRLLAKSNQFDIETAENGQEALDKYSSFKPDLITMDIIMPVMDGITAVEKIMAIAPVPILMFSALTREGAQATFDALDAGAIDYFPKQWNQISTNLDEVEAIIFRRISCLAQARPQVMQNSTVAPSPTVPAGRTETTYGLNGQDLIVIGSSTGGPGALERLLGAVDSALPVPIVIAQHMPAEFTCAFASRLKDKTGLNVTEASEGDPLLPGSVYVLPGGKQVKFQKSQGGYVIRLCEPEADDRFAPSVDTTLLAAKDAFGGRILAIILTGMGRDGCRGAELIKQSGAKIWVQDRQSSIVWGMPGAVAESDLADRIIEPGAIGMLLNRMNPHKSASHS